MPERLARTVTARTPAPLSAWSEIFWRRPETMIATTAKQYSTLAIQSRDELLYGTSPHPLACGLGLTIGGGQVFPEVNFTLPPMNMTDERSEEHTSELQSP